MSEQDTLPMRSQTNKPAPINRIPPEVLTLIPDFWDMHSRDKDVIALTHVCRAWREIFTSRSSLWTNFYCADAAKTRIYLERSKSSPINLRINRKNDLFPHDPLLQIIPLATDRLKSLRLVGSPESLPNITARLTHPVPLLEDLLIDGDCEFDPESNPVLTTSLFSGDLSSLRRLHLSSVRTELPWRTMVNLTSFSLWYTSPGEVTVRHLLDFFEGAPRLREIELPTPTPGSSVQDGRLVSLAYLKRAEFFECETTSILLSHLLIPVGASLTTWGGLPGPLIEDHLPKSLDNLRNLSDFTKIHLRVLPWISFLRFSGPNGQVRMFSMSTRTNTTCLVLDSLARFNTSKTERLRVDHGGPLSMDSTYRALLPMAALRTLALYQCQNPHFFIDALHPGVSPSGVVVCPNLEELILFDVAHGSTLGTEGFVGMAAARASRGAKLKTVRILAREVGFDVLELEKHVLHVECGPEVAVADGDSNIYYEED